MKLKDQIALKQTKSICRTSFVEDFYICKKEVLDKRFGLISIWRKRSGDDLVLMKTKQNLTKNEVKEEVSQIKDRMGLNHPYLLQMMDYSILNGSRNKFEIRTFFQAPLQDLKKEIKRRNKVNK